MKLLVFISVLGVIIALGLAAGKISFSYFSDSAVSDGNVFAASAEFPTTPTPTTTPPVSIVINEAVDIFTDLGLSIKDRSKKGIQYFLKYENNKGLENITRNILKIDASFPLFASSKYISQRFLEIDRVFICQTKETMFSH